MGLDTLRLMKWQKLKGTVKIPPMPRDQASIMTWCKAARECLIQLEGRLAPAPGAPSKGGAVASILPFQISVTEDSLKAAAGVLDMVTIPEIIESSPADGTWYLEAKITIDSSSGAITGRDVEWSSSASSNTTTEFYSIIGNVTVSGGVPDASTIYQGNYGPLIAIPYGTPTDKWGILIY